METMDEQVVVSSAGGAGLPAPLARRFEALVFDWERSAAPGRSAGTAEVRSLLEQLCAGGMDIAIVSEAAVDDLDGRLRARPRGPGRLLLAPHGGSELFEVGGAGPRLLPHRAPADEKAALDRAPPRAVDSPADRCLAAVLAELWAGGIAADQVLVVPSGRERFIELLAGQLDRRGDVPAVSHDPLWSVTAEQFDPARGRARESLLAISDGVIGTTAAPLLTHPGARPYVVAAGVYDGDGAKTDLLQGPRWASLGRPLDEHAQVVRVLDLHTGVLAEQATGATRLDSARFISLARPGVACLRATLDPPEDSGALAAPNGTVVTGHKRGVEWMATVGDRGSITAAAVQRRSGADLDRLAAFVRGDDGPLPDDAVEAVEDANRAGFNRLLVEHRRAFARRWANADIEVHGDDAMQRAVRVALFHLMAAVDDSGEAAVGARGLTGDAYLGHVFWDADLFVLPFLAATHPASARAMLEYRVRRLPAALAAGRHERHAGARFPWESATDGRDVTPRSGRDQAGREVPIVTGEAEVHIVGDVAWAASCYADWTGDETFRRREGHRLLVETARYWASTISLDEHGAGHLYRVVGPDEYHELVDDNAYTNVLARWNLRRAAVSVRRYGDPGVDPAELARWSELADALVDGYDPVTGVYEEFAGFFDLEPIHIADVAPRRPITADLLLGRDRVRQAQVVKQADVLMLHHLLPEEVVPGSLFGNLDYYEPRTAHGSSLSPGVHAALFARAGRPDEAVAALRIAANIDLEDQTDTGAGGVHLAAMGSVWQALTFGFMGVRPHEDALVIDPKLPPSWPELQVRLTFRGVGIVLRADHRSIVVHAQAPIRLEISGRRVTCPAGTTTFNDATRGAP